MKLKRKSFKVFAFYFLLIFLFSFFAGRALFHPGLLPTHDGEYHIIRFFEFDKTLRDGNLYPRWAPDLNYGFGIPLFTYVYPLPNYVASFFHLFSISFINSFKLEMFIALLLSGIFMFLWSRLLWGNLGGFVSSIFYLFSPYHFLDIYIRGSVGEVWALAFFPAFLWSITQYFQSGNKKFIFFSSIFFAFIVFSHNILSLMFLPFAFFYILFLAFQSKRRILFLIVSTASIVSGIFLSSIFWLPALVEKKYVTGLQIYKVLENFPDFYQLIIPSWGSGFSPDDLGNQMSFQIGAANLFAIAVSLYIVYKMWRNRRKEYKILLFFLFWFFMIFFLMLSISSFIWDKIPLMNYFQFPWRFLSLEILICSFIGGSIFWYFKSKLLVITMIILIFFLGFGYAQAPYYFNRTDNYYTRRSNFIDGTNSPGDLFNSIWRPKTVKKEKNKIAQNQDIQILNKQIKSTAYSFSIRAMKNSEVFINTEYFPGWAFSLDKDKFSPVENSGGFISLSIPKGEHVLMVNLLSTWVQQLAGILSLIIFAVLAFFVLMIKYYL